MLEKEFVHYQESLELKKLGFNEPCFGFYERGKELVIQECEITDFHFDSLQCLTPTFSQTFRWFREKGYDVKVQKESAGRYFGFYWTGAAWITVGAGSYEEAELACLRKLIEIVKGERA